MPLRRHDDECTIPFPQGFPKGAREEGSPMIGDAEIQQHAVLAGFALPGLPCSYSGKVRDAFDLTEGSRILVATDRLSVFDRVIGCIPFKGQILNQMALYWFQQTADIIANHVRAAIDPNAVVVERLDMLPIEIVVRAYMAGTSRTSLWTLYKTGERTLYGLRFPDGLQENHLLPHPVITPTTKAEGGGHDEPITAADIVTRGLLPADRWEEVASAALRLFVRGRDIPRRYGLILVDTKYEFGLTRDGRLMVADEVHTPDSSRYWLADSYEGRMARGEKPENLDKDFARAWVMARCDPYRQPIPSLPAETVVEFARRYMRLYEIVTGTPFVPPPADPPLATRVRINIERYRACLGS
ncbi:MAG: phosphoribosylaminoimidazole-succinocarboxamide synthase [Rhodospirillaceae bacterium]|nr:MAG: phosphoribosylaminoimidazole-succinocarboxamide synthase [Rhodospirillaceae bacterium]